jgi:putative DNA primase/helicase
MPFYKGYIVTKNKKPVRGYKNKSLMTLDEVEHLDEYSGILAEDAILIDVDDMEQSEILLHIVRDKGLKCRVYESRKGMHFLFKNTKVNKCYTKRPLAIGLVDIDCKVGRTNSIECLKIDGKERAILYDTEEYEDVPKYLTFINKKMDFLNMEAGQGRNQSLFSYILTLQSHDFSVEEARETIHILNKYVLKDPLDESEVDVILRDESFQKPVFYDGQKFLHDKFAVFLKNHHNIIRINGQLHIYQDGKYIADNRVIENAMIQHIPSLTSAKRIEVLKQLDILILENTPPAPPNIIAFRNGLYDVNTDTFKSFTPDAVITNMIPWDYNESAYNQTTDEVLNNIACDNRQIRMLLEELVGSCMYRSNHLAGGKAFVLTGIGSNGKSTFLDTLKQMLSDENVSVLDMKKLDDRFSTVMMFNKLANIGDDISDEFICDDAVFKKVVTGQSIDAEQKGMHKFQFQPTCKLIFSANNIPRIGKGRDSVAIMRRLIIVPFNANFKASDKTFNPNIGDDLKTSASMEYLIQLGLQGLKRVLDTRQYTNCKQIEDEMKEYEMQNNPVLMFFDHCEFEGFNIEDEVTNVVYDKYKEFCYDENLQAISKVWFSRQVTRVLGLVIKDKKVNGKKYRVFVRE